MEDDLMLQLTLNDPWFWAFLAMVGWAMGYAVVGAKSLGRRLGLGIMMLLLAETPRVIIALPFVTQPRILLNPAILIVVGTIILAASLFWGTAVVRIKPLTGPDSSEPLRTDGLYSLVRHPLMLCDIFWPLGWSILFGSVIGVLLTLAWLPVIWILTSIEEEALVREYGDAYHMYQSGVPRLFPRISKARQKSARDQ
jgi:protein-S-isoprenylcysteine O-methyltransferase Ste14